MIHAAGCGVTLTLTCTDPAERDPALSETTREAILAAITTGGREGPVEKDGRHRLANRAVALKAVLTEADQLTPGEQTLLSEWLDRLS